MGLGTIIVAHSQADRELLINELQHRVKNTLATLQGLLVSTLRSAASLADARKAVEERIVGLGRAHDVLMEEHWESAGLCELALSLVQPYRAEDSKRIEVSDGSQNFRECWIPAPLPPSR